MFCSISGVVPEQPVVSSKSGHLFERKLVEKFVRETGKCPVTNDALSLEDLLPLKASKTVKPRTSPATSIPGLLGLFHDEWDALMLETHSLRQSLQTTRQELSHALYMHDAATRVIARLIRERDEARSALQNVRAAMAAQEQEQQAAGKRAAEPVAMEEDAAAADGKRQKKEGLPDEVVEELQAVNTQLSKARKKRAIAESLATPDQLGSATVLASHPLHKTTQGGIVSMDRHPDQPSIVATAGLDGTVQVFDHAQGRVLASLEGHSKRLTGVAYATSNVLVSSSADKTARIWSGQGGSYSCTATLKEHSGEVVGVTMHPSRKYFVTGSSDATWCMYDVEKAECLRQVPAEHAGESFTTVQFHPDGLLLAIGTDSSLVRIWDVKHQKLAAKCEGHKGPIKGLAFSENGYHLASMTEDCVKLWDLRKLNNFRTLEPYEGAACGAVAFDHSGNYLAVGGADARIYNTKQAVYKAETLKEWNVIQTWADIPKKGVTSLLFGPDAKTLFVGAADHNLRVIGMADSENGMQE